MLCLKRLAFFAAAALLAFESQGMASCSTADESRGQDLEMAFARAEAGAPLRLAALGGSITQAGEGWIGDWLRQLFPKSLVAVRSAGMSATGSELGVFRLERDIISSQPDIVLIEYAVNDGGLQDEDAIRYLESIVVRLKSLEHPPAIVFIEAAAKNKSNRARHQKVAAHYGLVDVDLQEALDAHLAAKGLSWDTLMSDAVHPNKEGHAFYSEAIAKALTPYLERAKLVKASGACEFKPILPRPLSAKPLILDGRMEIMPLAPGWTFETGVNAWWDRFMLGVLSAKKPGSSLSIPFRGSFCGIFFSMDKSYGRFYASVDGAFPVIATTNSRGGYSHKMAGRDLEPCEHVLNIVIPKADAEAPVKLGYLLIAGETGSSLKRAPQGEFDIEAIATLGFSPVPASSWEWCGPFGGAEAVTGGPTSDLETVFPPEAEFLSGKSFGAAWRPLEGDAALVDFGKLTGNIDRGACYARAKIWSGKARRAHLGMSLDYFGKIWVNGVLVKTFAGGHGGASEPGFLPVELKQGWNEVFVKIHSGSLGNNFSLSVQNP